MPVWVRCLGTVGSPGVVGSPWQRGADTVITPADMIIPSLLLLIEEFYQAQLGCHLGFLPHSQALARAPWPHQPYASGYPVKEQTLTVIQRHISKIKAIGGMTNKCFHNDQK